MPDERQHDDMWFEFRARYDEHGGRWFWQCVSAPEPTPDASIAGARLIAVPESTREAAAAERDEALRELDRWRPDDAMTNAPKQNPTIIGLEAELERLKGELLRYESMGAVRAVADPLREALTNIQGESYLALLVGHEDGEVPDPITALKNINDLSRAALSPREDA